LLRAAGAPLLAACLFASADAFAERPQGGAAGPSKESTQYKKRSRFSLPPAHGAWLLRLTSSGGFLGGGGSVIITSEGNAAARRAYAYACTARVPPAELKELERLLRAAQSAEWGGAAPGGEREPPGRDLLKVRLEIRWHVTGGAQSARTAVWYGGGETRVPRELLSLQAGASRIAKSIVKGCTHYR
jgi:hypothetical protein